MPNKGPTRDEWLAGVYIMKAIDPGATNRVAESGQRRSRALHEPVTDDDLQEDLDARRLACPRSPSRGQRGRSCRQGWRKILGHIAEETAGKLAGDWVKKAVEGVRSHFTDHSERLTRALAQSNERAWKTIEIALGGQRFWDRFASAEDQALREQVKSFLESAVQEDDPGYLAASLKELRQARAKGHLTTSDGFRPEALAEEVGPFARFDDPEALLAAECSLVEEIAARSSAWGIAISAVCWR